MTIYNSHSFSFTLCKEDTSPHMVIRIYATLQDPWNEVLHVCTVQQCCCKNKSTSIIYYFLTQKEKEQASLKAALGNTLITGNHFAARLLGKNQKVGNFLRLGREEPKGPSETRLSGSAFNAFKLVIFWKPTFFRLDLYWQSQVWLCHFCTVRLGRTSFLKHTDDAGSASVTQINHSNSKISKIPWLAESTGRQMHTTLSQSTGQRLFILTANVYNEHTLTYSLVN